MILGDVTDSLTKLLKGFDVTVDSPANLQAGVNPPFARINLFLYQVLENQFTKNQNRITQNTGDQDYPPLSLDLYYLVTPYASDGLSAQRVLSDAMRVFYDNSIIRDAQVPESLRPIVDQLAIVLVHLELEDLTRIWNALQTPYRLSVVYEVRVVLIESTITTTPSRVTTKVNLYGQKSL